MKNSQDILYAQRGVYKETNTGSNSEYEQNVWKYSPVNLSELNINPFNPMVSESDSGLVTQLKQPGNNPTMALA